MAKENTEEIKEASNFINDFITKDLEDGVYSQSANTLSSGA